MVAVVLLLSKPLTQTPEKKVGILSRFPNEIAKN